MQIITLPYSAQPATVFAIREAVFVQEQGVPVAIEIDDRDAHCLHALAFDGEYAVGTGRIDFAQAGKIGRIAILKAYRQQGIGTQLMLTLEQAGQVHGLTSVWLHAQVAVLSFYQHLGYVIDSEIFMEANIPHQTMRKQFIN